MFLLVMSRAGVSNTLVQGQQKVFEVVEVVVRKLSSRAIKSVERRIQRVRAVEGLLQEFYRLGGVVLCCLGARSRPFPHGAMATVECAVV